MNIIYGILCITIGICSFFYTRWCLKKVKDNYLRYGMWQGYAGAIGFVILG